MSAASCHPKCSSIMTPESTTDPGLTLCVGVPDELVFGTFNDERVFEIVKNRGKEEFLLSENDFLFGHRVTFLPSLVGRTVTHNSDGAAMARTVRGG